MTQTLKFEELLTEMDFGSMAKTLGKYAGKNAPDDAAKKSNKTRGFMTKDITLTGHREKDNNSGRKVYTKILPDDDDKDLAANVEKQFEDPKKSKGRPAGAINKSSVKKGWSPEARASMKAKLASRKAEKAAANESQTLQCEDWDSIVNHDNPIESILDLITDDDYNSLDKESRQSLKDYVKKLLDSGEVSAKEVVSKGMKESTDVASDMVVTTSALPAGGFASSVIMNRGANGVSKWKSPNKFTTKKIAEGQAQVWLDTFLKEGEERANSNAEQYCSKNSAYCFAPVVSEGVGYYAQRLNKNLIKE